jgi:hypothetical protein
MAGKLAPVKKLITVIGEYTNAQGEAKKKYLNVGTMFKREDGSFALKIDALPVTGFTGWVGIVDLDENKQQGTRAAQATPPPAPQAPAPVSQSQAFGGDDSDLPF